MRHLLYMLIDWFSILVFAIPAVWALNHFLWKENKTHTIWSLILVVYLAKMYDIVGIPAAVYMVWDPSVNFVPCADFGDSRFFFQMGANAVMLMPLGFLLPMLWDSKRSIVRTTVTGALVSVMIETMQLFCYRATDIDDLMMNTLGAFLGCCVFAVLNRFSWKKACDPARGRRDNFQFWITNLVVILVIVFLRTPFSDAICNWFFV